MYIWYLQHYIICISVSSSFFIAASLISIEFSFLIRFFFNLPCGNFVIFKTLQLTHGKNWFLIFTKKKILISSEKHRLHLILFDLILFAFLFYFVCFYFCFLRFARSQILFQSIHLIFPDIQIITELRNSFTFSLQCFCTDNMRILFENWLTNHRIYCNHSLNGVWLIEKLYVEIKCKI